MLYYDLSKGTNPAKATILNNVLSAIIGILIMVSDFKILLVMVVII